MKIYFPFCGVGFGHFSRSLVLAHALKQKGHEIVMATHPPLLIKAKKTGFKVYKSEQEFLVFKSQENLNMAKTFFTTALKSPALLPNVGRQREIIRKLSPDLIISDSYISSLIASKLEQNRKPYYFLTNQTDTAEFFSGSAFGLGRKLIDKILEEVILNSQKTLVPDFSSAICKKNINFFHRRSRFVFTGPLVAKRSEEVKAKVFRRKTGLVCIGGSGCNVDFFSLLEKIGEKHNIQFIIANSGKESKKNNIIYKKYIPDYFSYLKGSDFVISHGGHQSLMESLTFGKPVIGLSVSGFYERENNLKGLRSAGTGTYLDIDDKNLEEKMEKEISKTKRYAKKARSFAKQAKKQRGEEAITKIINQRMG